MKTKAVGPTTRAIVDIGATIAAFASGAGFGSFGVGSAASATFVALDKVINAAYKLLTGQPQSAQDITHFP